MNALQSAANATRHILIVEDDTLIGMGLAAMLEAIGHVVVGQASTTQEAIDLYRACTPDLVLMDIHLDDSDGIELTRRLLSERRAPIVIVSAYSEPELIARAAAAGVFGYIVKPVTPGALKAQIDVAVRRLRRTGTSPPRQRAARGHAGNAQAGQAHKGLLMKTLKLDEDAAHRRLQLEAQKRRLNIADAARRVLEAEHRL